MGKAISVIETDYTTSSAFGQVFLNIAGAVDSRLRYFDMPEEVLCVDFWVKRLSDLFPNAVDDAEEVGLFELKEKPNWGLKRHMKWHALTMFFQNLIQCI